MTEENRQDLPPTEQGNEKALAEASQFAFDPLNKIMLIRLRGRITDESLLKSYRTAQRYASLMDVAVCITDFSLASKCDVSTDLIRHLAIQKPIVPHARRPSFIIAPKTFVFGLARMYQIMGESSRPLLRVVHTIEDALAILRIESPHFDLLE